MNITVNGRLLDMNIGCRTFTSVSKLLDLLKVDELPSSIGLNGRPIGRLDYAATTVNSGDKLDFPSSPQKPEQ